MDGENVNERTRDRVELSLDGRQIASVVVGALVLLGVVFVLGLNVGRQLAKRQLDAARGDDLAALDQVPAPAATPPRDEALTFHERLIRDRPMAPEGTVTPPPLAAPAVVATAPTPAEPAPAPPAASPPAAAPAPAPARAATPAGAFSVQVAATPSRADADRLARKLEAYEPRIEPTEVPGKGRYWRVRLGAFATRAEAERFLKTYASRTGSTGLVVAAR